MTVCHCRTVRCTVPTWSQPRPAWIPPWRQRRGLSEPQLPGSLPNDTGVSDSDSRSAALVLFSLFQGRSVGIESAPAQAFQVSLSPGPAPTRSSTRTGPVGPSGAVSEPLGSGPGPLTGRRRRLPWPATMVSASSGQCPGNWPALAQQCPASSWAPAAGPDSESEEVSAVDSVQGRGNTTRTDTQRRRTRGHGLSHSPPRAASASAAASSSAPAAAAAAAVAPVCPGGGVSGAS